MAALFSPRASQIARRILGTGLALVVAVPVGLMIWVRTPAVTGQGRSAKQPVPFDHRIHVTGLRIDCLYCHQTADRASTAGLPATATCVSCHNAVWLSGPLFAAVRQSLASRRPIAWQRVDQLPDFVFFNHAIHIRGGIACESCHGRVDEMAQVRQAAPLTMGWCLDCHQHPEPRRRPVEAISVMGWHAPRGAARPVPLSSARVEAITTCSACHR
jgi:hypothetical protein